VVLKKNKNIYRTSFVSIFLSLIISGCSINSDNSNQDEEYTQNVYLPHEQTISIPIENDEDYTSEVVQYDSNLGYRPVAFSFESYGRVIDFVHDLNIVFTNECEVIATPGKIGTPVEKSENDNKNYVFDSYQHILSVPIEEDNCYEDVKEYPYHEGYEVVGMDTVSWGELYPINSKEVLLYVNTCPVEVKNYILEDDKIKSTEFGRPISLENENNRGRQKVKYKLIDDVKFF